MFACFYLLDDATSIDSLAKPSRRPDFRARAGTEGFSEGEWRLRPDITIPIDWRCDLPYFFLDGGLYTDGPFEVEEYADDDLHHPVKRYVTPSLEGLDAIAYSLCPYQFVENVLREIADGSLGSGGSIDTDTSTMGGERPPRSSRGTVPDAGEVEGVGGAVIIHASGRTPDLFGLELRLTEAIEEAGVGEFDGIERDAKVHTMYMYGPDAERLYEAIRPVLDSVKFGRGSYLIVQQGESGSPERIVQLRK